MKLTMIVLSSVIGLAAPSFAEAKEGRRQGPPAPEEMVSHLMEEFDIDASSAFSPTELVTALVFLESNRPERHNGPPADAPEGRDGPPSAEEIAEYLLVNYDTNEDGEIQADEFLDGMASIRPERGRRKHSTS